MAYHDIIFPLTDFQSEQTSSQQQSSESRQNERADDVETR